MYTHTMDIGTTVFVDVIQIILTVFSEHLFYNDFIVFLLDWQYYIIISEFS